MNVEATSFLERDMNVAATSFLDPETGTMNAEHPTFKIERRRFEDEDGLGIESGRDAFPAVFDSGALYLLSRRAGIC